MPKILVINPNSSTDVTDSIDGGLDLIRPHMNFEIECKTLAEGPPGIECQEDIEQVVLLFSCKVSQDSVCHVFDVIDPLPDILIINLVEEFADIADRFF